MFLTDDPSVHSFHYSPCFPQYARHELKKNRRYKTNGANAEIFFIEGGREGAVIRTKTLCLIGLFVIGDCLLPPRGRIRNYMT